MLGVFCVTLWLVLRGEGQALGRRRMGRQVGRPMEEKARQGEGSTLQQLEPGSIPWQVLREGNCSAVPHHRSCIDTLPAAVPSDPLPSESGPREQQTAGPRQTSANCLLQRLANYNLLADLQSRCTSFCTFRPDGKGITT